MRSASVAVGGAAGTLGRWMVAQLAPSPPPLFPWGTLLVNVAGAFLLGTVSVVMLETAGGRSLARSFLGVGFLASFTTFSGIGVEGVRLLEAGAVGPAFTYWGATLALGLTAGALGMETGRLLAGPRREAG